MWPRKMYMPRSGPFLRQGGHPIDHMCAKQYVQIHHLSLTEYRKLILFKCNPT